MTSVTVRELAVLFVFVLACALAAAPGIVLRPGEWYRILKKPRWNPPNALFGPVWALLYLVIALAGWMVWRRGAIDGAVVALIVYSVQLVLNGLWSVLFFGAQRPGWALVDILCLCAAIAATIAAFWPIHTAAAWLLVPYLGWVVFATLLNYRIWRLNMF